MHHQELLHVFLGFCLGKVGLDVLHVLCRIMGLAHHNGFLPLVLWVEMEGCSLRCVHPPTPVTKSNHPFFNAVSKDPCFSETNAWFLCSAMP